MVVVVYLAGAMVVGRTAALAGGAAMFSMPQVLQLGRTGETDALFSFLVSASLLIWFIGYHRKWPKSLVWSLGYALAALGTLTKGIQATPYFVGTTCVFLLWRRDWRYLFSWGHLLGIGVFAVIFGAWAVPFAQRMGLGGLYEIFHRDSADQWQDVSIGSFLKQILTMPVRVIVSVLPWIALFTLFLLPKVRRQLAAHKTAVTFLLVALAVTWPTVWLSPTSQNRHFMPLYPCLAVLVALAVAPLLTPVAERDETAVKWWRFFLGVLSVVMIGIAVGMTLFAFPAAIALLAKFLPKAQLGYLRLSPLMAVIFGGGTLVLAALTQWASRRVEPRRVRVGALSVAVFLGLLMVGPGLSLDIARAVDIRPGVAQLRQTIGPKPLISYGPTAHLFAYYYRQHIPLWDFPKSAEDSAAQVEYFCYYGGAEGIADPKLPFAWEKVGEYCCDRIRGDNPKVLIVVGRKIPGTTASTH